MSNRIGATERQTAYRANYERLLDGRGGEPTDLYVSPVEVGYAITACEEAVAKLRETGEQVERLRTLEEETLPQLRRVLEAAQRGVSEGHPGVPYLHPDVYDADRFEEPLTREEVALLADVSSDRAHGSEWSGFQSASHRMYSPVSVANDHPDGLRPAPQKWKRSVGAVQGRRGAAPSSSSSRLGASLLRKLRRAGFGEQDLRSLVRDNQIAVNVANDGIRFFDIAVVTGREQRFMDIMHDRLGFEDDETFSRGVWRCGQSRGVPDHIFVEKSSPFYARARAVADRLRVLHGVPTLEQVMQHGTWGYDPPAARRIQASMTALDRTLARAQADGSITLEEHGRILHALRCLRSTTDTLRRRWQLTREEARALGAIHDDLVTLQREVEEAVGGAVFRPYFITLSPALSRFGAAATTPSRVDWGEPMPLPGDPHFSVRRGDDDSVIVEGPPGAPVYLDEARARPAGFLDASGRLELGPRESVIVELGGPDASATSRVVSHAHRASAHESRLRYRGLRAAIEQAGVRLVNAGRHGDAWKLRSAADQPLRVVIREEPELLNGVDVIEYQRGRPSARAYTNDAGERVLVLTARSRSELYVPKTLEAAPSVLAYRLGLPSWRTAWRGPEADEVRTALLDRQ